MRGGERIAAHEFAVARFGPEIAVLPGDPAARQSICERLNSLPFEKLSTEQRLDAWRVYSIVFTRLGKPSESIAKSATELLAKQYPQELEEPNQKLCELLAYLDRCVLVGYRCVVTVCISYAQPVLNKLREQ